MQPPNLTALHNTLVIELVLDDGNYLFFSTSVNKLSCYLFFVYPTYSGIVHKVKTVTASGPQHSFRGKKIVLCAGTLDSPALLLRSGIQAQPHKGNKEKVNDEKVKDDKAKDEKDKDDKAKDDKAKYDKVKYEKAQDKKEKDKLVKSEMAKSKMEKSEKEEGAVCVPKYTGVTDHNIYGFRFTIDGGREIEAAKLQLEGEVSMHAPTQAGGSKDTTKIPFLLNICINAHSFLSRGFEEEEEEEEVNDNPDGVCILTYEFRAPINNNNYVTLDVYTGQPILHIKNSGEETV
jgi:GMC oxidoreductase